MVFVFAFLRLLFVCAFLHLSVHACVFAFLRLQPPAFLGTCTYVPQLLCTAVDMCCRRQCACAAIDNVHVLPQ